MNNIKSIKITYDNGVIENIPSNTISTIQYLSSAYSNFNNFLTMLLHLWDIKYQLRQQEKSYEQDIKDLEESHSMQIDSLSKSHDKSIIKQRGVLKGMNLEKWIPCLKEFPYSNGDVIGVYDTFDLLVLEGRSNHYITGIKFQEIKTGTSQLDDNQRALKRFIDEVDNPHIKLDVWTRKDTDSVFRLSKQRKLKSNKGV